jgi:hypothetical protein
LINGANIGLIVAKNAFKPKKHAEYEYINPLDVDMHVAVLDRTDAQDDLLPWPLRRFATAYLPEYPQMAR